MRALAMIVGLCVSTSAVALTPLQERNALLTHLEKNIATETTSELFDAINARDEFIQSNTEERYIIVNLKSYEMQVIENGQAVMRQKVVVGRNNRKTPVFNDVLTHVVLNPYWNVPTSLARKDVIPKIKKKGGAAVGRYGYTMIERSSGNVVPFDVDADLSKYRIRQNPGPTNSLGRIKFMFTSGSGRAIYLHDTPSRHLFNRNRREYSSGCVRIQEPLRFAGYLMGQSESTIDERIKNLDSERWLKINPIKVYIVDWPVFVDASGTVRHNRDIKNVKRKPKKK